MPQKPKYENPLWSILIPTVPGRVSGCFSDLISELLEMRGYRDIEILGLFDNKRRSIGGKRNSLLQIARGDYVSFVDDDDEVDSKYIDRCYNAIVENEGVDLITFNMLRVDPAGNRLTCKHNGISPEDSGMLEDGSWDGHPTHLMLWRRALAESFYFPDSSWAEDMDWARSAVRGVRTRFNIDEVLYVYKMNIESIRKAEEARSENRMGNS